MIKYLFVLIVILVVVAVVIFVARSLREETTQPPVESTTLPSPTFTPTPTPTPLPIESRFTLDLSVVGGQFSGVKLDPPPGADGRYALGTSVTLRARDGQFDHFVGWQGDASGGDKETIVSTDRDLRIDAVFKFLCFAAGTPILTPGGYFAIEELQIGDRIVSYDHNLQALVETNIVAVPSRGVNNLLRVVLADEATILVTGEHPFFDLDDSVYKPIGEFQIGERLARIGGDEQLEAVAVFNVVPFNGEFTVYNLSVENANHNYVAAGVLVHNKTAPPSPNPPQTSPFTVTKTADTHDEACDGACSLREAVEAA